MATRAIEAVKNEAMLLVEVRVKGAVEAEDWVALHRLAEQLQDLAHRGIHHAAHSPERLAELARMCNIQGEREAR